MPASLNFEHRLGPVRPVDRNAFLLERARGKKVLHLGCADEHVVNMKLSKGVHLHAQLKSVASELWGVDLSAEGISQLREAGYDNLIRGDVERLDEIDGLPHQHFDVIIAGEIIEHLLNPGLFLTSCRRVCSAGTALILTTPNALVYSLPIFALLGREAIHPDHTLMWSPTTMKSLVERCGFAVDEFLVYGGTPCVQLGSREPLWKRSARVALRSVDVAVRHTVVRFRPWLNDGLIVVVRPQA